MEPPIQDLSSNNQFTDSIIQLINDMVSSGRVIDDINRLPFPEQSVNAFGNSFGLNDILQRSISDAKPVYKHVISDEGKEKLQNLTFTNDLSCNICPITQEEFQDGQGIIKLPCGHYFNEKSILEWLENTKAECPLCRHELPSKELRDENKDSASDYASDEDTDDEGEPMLPLLPPPQTENINVPDNEMYTRIMRRFVRPPPDIFSDDETTQIYLSQNIQHMYNNVDDYQLQETLLLSLMTINDV